MRWCAESWAWKFLVPTLAGCCKAPSTFSNCMTACLPNQHQLSTCFMQQVGTSEVFMMIAAKLSTQIGMVGSTSFSPWNRWEMTLFMWNICIMAAECSCSWIPQLAVGLDWEPRKYGQLDLLGTHECHMPWICICHLLAWPQSAKDNICWLETFEFWNSFKHLGNNRLVNIFGMDQRTRRMASKVV